MPFDLLSCSDADLVRLTAKPPEQLYAACLEGSAISPDAFRAFLFLDADSPFEPTGFQAADFAAADPGWLRCIGQPVQNGKQRLWLERTRGSSKTTDVAIMALWPLAFAHRGVIGIVGAGDRDQAGLLRDAIERLLKTNPWLGDLLKINRWEVRNPETGSRLEIMSSDAGTSYGQLADFIIADEVCHWKEASGARFWESLLSTSAKPAPATGGTPLLIVITNAGYVDSWQWQLREKIRKDEAWHFHALEVPAPWIGRSQLQEQERLLPPKEYRRLWLNQWVSAAGAEWPESYFPNSIWFADWPENLLVKVVCLDPTQGKTSKPGDYAAFVTLGVDRAACLWAKCEAHLNWTSSQQAERLVSIYQEEQATAVGIETVLFAALLKEEVDRIGRQRLGTVLRSYGINVNRPGMANMPKAQRILLLTPYLSQGKLRVMDNEGGRLLVQQMRNFSTKPEAGQHDDAPDCLEQAECLIKHILGERRKAKDVSHGSALPLTA